MKPRSSVWSGPVLVAVVVIAACSPTSLETPDAQPSAHPTPPNADERCLLPGEEEGRPNNYRPLGDPIEGDFPGDGIVTRAQILEDEERPPKCRYFLAVDGPRSPGSYIPIEGASSLPHDVPSLLPAFEIDRRPGLEIVVDFGGPMHPHRTGQIFSFERGSLVAMRTERPQFEGGSPILFPLHGEFASGVDCAGELGALVVTWGDLAEGGADDSHFDVTRTFYRTRGNEFVEIRHEMHTVEVGTERERWPELDDDPFRSCPAN